METQRHKDSESKEIQAPLLWASNVQKGIPVDPC